MLYPALVMKLIGFKDRMGNINRFPQRDSNIIQVQLDTGDIIDIDIFSNDKDMNSLFDYLDNKSQQGVKENKIKSLAMDLVFAENHKYTTMITKVENELIRNGVSQSKAKQEAALKVVSDILKENSTLQSASIFRIALAAGNNKYNSKSIYVKMNESGDKAYSTSGIYSHAQLENQIPIELSYIYNSEQQPIGFMKAKTSKLINAKQINYLLDHCFRTIEQSLSRGKKPFLPLFLIESNNNDYTNLALQFNRIHVENRKSESILSQDKYDFAKKLLIDIKKSLLANKSLYSLFSLELPLLLANEKFSLAVKTIGEHGKSPFQLLREALVNLNFSKENPSVKQNLKDHILSAFIIPIINAQYSPKLLTVYNIPAPTLLGDSDSWGFMTDNIDFSKLSLGKEDIDRIYKYCENMVK